MDYYWGREGRLIFHHMDFTFSLHFTHEIESSPAFTNSIWIYGRRNECVMYRLNNSVFFMRRECKSGSPLNETEWFFGREHNERRAIPGCAFWGYSNAALTRVFFSDDPNKSVWLNGIHLKQTFNTTAFYLDKRICVLLYLHGWKYNQADDLYELIFFPLPPSDSKCECELQNLLCSANTFSLQWSLEMWGFV